MTLKRVKKSWPWTLLCGLENMEKRGSPEHSFFSTKAPTYKFTDQWVQNFSNMSKNYSIIVKNISSLQKRNVRTVRIAPFLEDRSKVYRWHKKRSKRTGIDRYLVLKNRIFWNGGRTKEPILNETKSPILETGQNRRFRKWDKTADSENETKPPISKMKQNRRFCKREQIAIKIVSLIKASWPNYR